MLNALTVDFEEYFQGILTIAPSTYDSYAGRIDFLTERILELFDRHAVSATFFVSGYTAKRYPHVVRKIFQAGHEIASHGYQHGLVYRMTKEEFRRDIQMSGELITRCTDGETPKGFRAPWWSINQASHWVWEILSEAGFSYDSSIYPIRMKYYGIPGAKRGPYIIEGTDLLEIPPATIEIMGCRLAVAGGFYWRHYPLSFIRWSLRRLQRENMNAVCIFHPWEIDTEQPRLTGIPFEQRLIHYSGRASLERKLHRILTEFRFASIREVFNLAGQKESNRSANA